VRANLEALVRIYLGQLSVADAKRSGLVRAEGSRELARSMAEWFPRSGFAAHAHPVSFDPFSRSFVQASA